MTSSESDACIRVRVSVVICTFIEPSLPLSPTILNLRAPLVTLNFASLKHPPSISCSEPLAFNP